MRYPHPSGVTSGGIDDGTLSTAGCRGADEGLIHTGFGAYLSVSTTRSMPQVRQTRINVRTFDAASYREVLSCRWSHIQALAFADVFSHA
jgi:hypothetical protein